MLKTTTVLTLLIIIIASCSASCSRPAGNSPAAPTSSGVTESRRISSVDVVKADPAEVTIARGGTADAEVRLTIDQGYHVNANPPSFPYLKATELELTPGEGLSVSFTKYPNPLLKKFSFSDAPLAVYEGETTVTVRIKADKSIVPGKKNLSGKLRVQACDDQVCYAPAAKDIVIPVNVL